MNICEKPYTIISKPNLPTHLEMKEYKQIAPKQESNPTNNVNIYIKETDSIEAYRYLISKEEYILKRKNQFKQFYKTYRKSI
jgi:hypothetical protein